MFDFHWGNKPQAYIACLALFAACQNPGLDRDPSEPAAGAAGSAAVKAFGAAGGPTNVAAIGRTAESSKAIMDSSSPRSAPTPCAEASSAQAGCAGRMAGVYGVAMDLDVVWSDEVNLSAPAYDPGRGKISTLLLGEVSGLCPGEAEGELILRVCDVRLPPIYIGSNGGIVQLVIPQTTWQRRGMPEYTARVRASGSESSEFSIDRITAMLGIELASMDAPWPAYTDTPFVTCSGGNEGSGCFPDQDEDGEPGISLEVRLDGPPPSAAVIRRGGWSYTPVPTDVSFSYLGTGATTLFAGLRTQFGGAYPVGPDCNGDAGEAEAGDVALRVFDCKMVDGTRCTPNAATVADQNMPVFRGRGAQNTLIRLGDLGEDLGCADVRAVFAEAR
jgi:hypothetical protein